MVSRVHIERRRAGGFPEPWRWSISGLESLLRGREETARLACVWVSGWTRVLCPELPGQRGAGRPPTIWPGNSAGWKAFLHAFVLAHVPRDLAWAPRVVAWVGGHSPKALERGRPGRACGALRSATKSQPC